VFEEHLFTELTKRLLRQAIAALPAGPRPARAADQRAGRAARAGPADGRGAVCLEGAECIPLGTQMPLLEISRAAEAHRADIVALSFSVAFPQRQIPGLLQQLRQMLPANIDLWAGGRGVAQWPVRKACSSSPPSTTPSPPWPRRAARATAS
jgi:hypothetical protein